MGHRWLTMAAIVLTAASVVDAQRSASVKASAPQALQSARHVSAVDPI
jgi:hypothetical protein